MPKRAVSRKALTRPDIIRLVLNQAQTLTHHFARALITPLSHEPLDKLSPVICENDIPHRHGHHLAIALIG